MDSFFENVKKKLLSSLFDFENDMNNTSEANHSELFWKMMVMIKVLAKWVKEQSKGMLKTIY